MRVSANIKCVVGKLKYPSEFKWVLRCTVRFVPPLLEMYALVDWRGTNFRRISQIHPKPPLTTHPRHQILHLCAIIYVYAGAPARGLDATRP